MNDLCDKCKIIKKIGNGVFGITYMVKYKNKKYAMKIQKILKYDLKKSTSSNIWREIYFAKKMSKYPDQFMKLYCYKIMNSCIHLQPDPEFKPNKRLHEYLAALSDSPYCMKLIYDLKDGIIDELFWNKKMTQKQIYSYISQIMYIIYLMKKNHFTHADMHARNITFKKTDKKYITIGTIKVRTHGYIYSVIDYGEVIHPSFENLSEWHHNRMNNDICDFTEVIENLLIGFNSGLWYLIRNNKFKDYDKLWENIRKSKEYKKLKEKYNFTENNREDMLLFNGIYPEISLKIAGVKKMKPYYKKRLVSVDDYVFMWENRMNLKTIITYFANKANE